jgi:hypothetical protein
MQKYRLNCQTLLAIALLSIVLSINGCGFSSPKPKASTDTEKDTLDITVPRWGYVDPVGQFVIKPQYDVAQSFSQGLAAVRSDGLWGFIDKQGKLVVPCRYQAARQFSEDLAPVMLDGKWGYINTKGEMVIGNRYSECKPFSEHLAGVRTDDKSWGFVNGDTSRLL